MNRLGFVIAFTSDIEGMKQFYRDRIGLAVRSESPFFVEFGTGPASFSLLQVRPEQKREIELCFITADVGAEVQALEGRGMEFPAGIRALEFGQVAHARDPEGTLISMLEPAAAPAAPAVAAPGRPAFSVAIVTARDLAAARSFYRDRLGLHAQTESTGWAEFPASGASIALHSRVGRLGSEAESGPPITLVFTVDDLNVWADEARARGVHFTAVPEDRGFGPVADTVDPDGNPLTFREPVSEPALEETLAEAFEDDGAPAVTAMRKPLKKGSKAVSRLVNRPEYKTNGKASANGKKKAGRAKVKAAAARKGARASSTRGAGLAHARLKPKRTADSKRARTRPATGRLKKAERRNVERKKIADASAGKSKPVKHAAQSAGKKRRATSRTTRRKQAGARRG